LCVASVSTTSSSIGIPTPSLASVSQETS